MAHNGTILLNTKWLNNRPDLQQKLNFQCQFDPKNEHLDSEFLMVEYRPYSATKGKIRLALNADMKLSVPNFIMDPVIQLFAKQFLNNLLEIANNFKGSEWEKRSLQKPEFI